MSGRCRLFSLKKEHYILAHLFLKVTVMHLGLVAPLIKPPTHCCMYGTKETLDFINYPSRHAANFFFRN